MGFWSRRNWLTLAALGGLASVAAGAFATHGMAGDPRAQELLKTGALYGFMHCLATFAAAGVMQWGGRPARFAPGFFLAGALLFSGSLFALAFGAPRWVGIATPFGGLSFMAGWAVLAWAAREVDPIA
ncbi:DUF423 domain-containing protein [Phenylobacterium sp.]|uniref:DUF423 domain-containing protein n=1 Tax=Phenylobacterium sp. TaxID=1871053 RepID=UPI0012085920|nr:DUF423 domain-containing protein [Phenylobacterium sp.]THD63263.1 MAG: DUF423 domain-containing protein [Phenylobacterium sp.]